MLKITAQQMQVLEDRAWADTARYVDLDLDARAHDDDELARALAALPPEARGRMIEDAVGSARTHGFSRRDEVSALALLFAIRGPGVDRQVLTRRDLDPLERVAVMDRLARFGRSDGL